MQLKSENSPSAQVLACCSCNLGKGASLVFNVGGINVVEDWNGNKLLFLVKLHYQLELVQTPSRGDIVGRDNQDRKLRILYSFLNFFGNGVANLKCFIIFEYFVNSPATECSVQKAGDASAGIFSSEAEEHIVLPHDTRQLHWYNVYLCRGDSWLGAYKGELGRRFLIFGLIEFNKTIRT